MKSTINSKNKSAINSTIHFKSKTKTASNPEISLEFTLQGLKNLLLHEKDNDRIKFIKEKIKSKIIESQNNHSVLMRFI